MPKLRKYDKNKLIEAVKDVQNGTESYRTAEKKYGIPKSTIEFKLKHPEHKDTLGPSPILTCEEENTLVRWIQETASKGFPKKANDLKSSVQKFLTENPRPNNFKDNRPGDGWLKGFLKRHPEVSKRTSEGVTAASACVSERDIKNWFKNIETYVKEKHLEEVLTDPSRIFNGDESGFQICPSTGKVFAMKGSKNVYNVEKSCSKENVTVMFTFSADGKICVPMVIYPYQRIPEKVAKGINPKWGVGRSDNGWMTAETFYQYIANVFYPHLIENNIKLPVILFVDGHKSHLSYQLSLLCNELQIEVIALYPNATRILQPCDVSIFRPLKEAWRQSVREWEEQHPGGVVNKVVFASILEQATKKSCKTETVVNGFKVCGLFPFKADAIDYTKCLGKEVVKNLIISDHQKKPKMDYNTFVNILVPEKVHSLENLKENQKNNLPSDDNLNLLFKIWNFFEHDPKHSDNQMVLKNRDTNINIIQNIAITSPVKNTEIKTSEKSGIENHRQHIPNDGDLFICHNCFNLQDSDSIANNSNQDSEDEDIDELFTQYKEAQKQL
ncbi:uncharacterized protein LOC126880945 [Diabrotica virgifera virgifera]|uniref:HTH CENPB-type domain-containing protein n=2 Tax=Diabrotica virgifera virgifera TaxID=50390 RepID=A0ABM5JSQ8_DIAVI|nr:uncharacterized protein LOC126880945 [Diabrotica virgifera virgifera]